MKIALITPGITPYVMGGMQRHSFNLARHLARLGVEIDLYHTDFGAAEGIDELEQMRPEERRNITSIAVPWPRSKSWPGHYIRELREFSEEVYRRYRERPAADFIIGKSLTAWAMVEAKGRGASLPPVGVNIHGYEMFQDPGCLRSRLLNLVMRPSFGRHVRRADYVFSYGGRITDLIRDRVGIPAERILEIPGGIDAGWLADAPSPVSSPRRFLFLGRHERRKGIEELHQVIAENPAWSRAAHFRLVGPIPPGRRLKLDHVSYAGSLSDPTELRHELHEADVLVCPSHAEGMPNSILEGMASGLAVLATDVGAVRLMVGEDNGVLLPGVSKPGLAAAIRRMLGADDGELGTMKRRSLEKVRRFSWDAVARKTLDEVERCVGR